MRKYNKLKIIFLSLLMIFILSGCSQSDWSDLADFAKEWALEHEVLTCKTKVPIFGEITLPIPIPSDKTNKRLEQGASTGDPDADAVIDAGSVVYNFSQAEKLSKEAKDKKDITKVDQAIKIRPNEFRYYNQKGAMLFNDINQIDKAMENFEKADKIARSYGTAYEVRNLESRIGYLRKQMDILEDQLSKKLISQLTYDQLSSKYEDLRDDIYSRLNDLEQD